MARETLTTESATTGFAVAQVTGGDTGSVGLSCDTDSWPIGDGRIVLLRVVGEIDLLSYVKLHTALDTALLGATDMPTYYLVVDLAGVSFCCMRGFALFAATARAATENGIGYALSGCNPHLERHWPILFPHRDDADVAGLKADVKAGSGADQAV